MIEITFIDENNCRYFSNLIPEESRDWSIRFELLMFGAVIDGKACGLLVVGMRQGMGEIVWMRIADEYRMSGVAGRMIEFVEENAKAFGIKVLSHMFCSDEETMYGTNVMYLKHGYSLTTEQSLCYRIKVKELLKSSFAEKGMKKADKYKNIQPFKTLPSHYFNRIPEIVRVRSYEDYDGDLSMMYLKKDDVDGFVLVRNLRGFRYDLELLYSETGNPAVVMALLESCTAALAEKVKAGSVRPDALVTFQLSEDMGDVLPRKLLGLEPYSSPWYYIAQKSFV